MARERGLVSADLTRRALVFAAATLLAPTVVLAAVAPPPGAAEGPFYPLRIPSDDDAGAPPVMVLTHDYWTRMFGADPQIVGQTVKLTTKSVEVVGVLEAGSHYTGRRKPDVFTNYTTNDHYTGAAMRDARTHRMTDVFGRLAPGATLQGGAGRADPDQPATPGGISCGLSRGLRLRDHRAPMAGGPHRIRPSDLPDHDGHRAHGAPPGVCQRGELDVDPVDPTGARVGRTRCVGRW